MTLPASPNAIRRAHEAKAARQHSQARIESVLADYYQAAAIAEWIRDTARCKADRSR